MRKFILILIIMFFYGCSSSVKIITLKSNEVLKNKYVSFNSPPNNWYLYNDKSWILQANGKAQWINLNNNFIKGTTNDIEVQTYPYNWMPIDILFDKNGEFDNGRHVSFDDDKEKNINYRVLYTMYMNNLKCVGKVYSQGFGGSVYSATSKNYSITCGYYDTTEKENDGKRILSIDYRYRYASGNTRLQKDADLKRDELVTSKQAEDGLKQAVKELVKTIKIKNIDIPRMEKEGLMHYDKEFTSTKW